LKKKKKDKERELVLLFFKKLQLIVEEMNERGVAVAVAVVGYKPKKGTSWPIPTGANGFGIQSPYYKLQEEKKEGRGRKDGEDSEAGRQDPESKKNVRVVSSRVKRMKPDKWGFKLNQWK